MHSPGTATADHARAHKLQAAQSLAMLDSQFKSLSSQEESTTDPVDDPSLSLQISVRRGRLALLVGLVTCLIVAITLVLWRGAELKRFTRAELSVSAQEKLLDQYNSYSGNAASALGRPLELFLALMAQVVVLWLMTDAVLSVNTSWRVKLAVLALGASVGFLLTNGLNALNVQVRELPLKMVMSTSDMSVITSTSTGNASSASSEDLDSSHYIDPALPESSALNPTNNTIFRSLLLPRVPVKPVCKGGVGTIEPDTVTFGMRQQPWMNHFLPEALPEASVRINLLTNDTRGAASAFPMDASVAADLLLVGYNAREDYSSVRSDLDIDTDYYPRLNFYVNASVEKQYVPTARLVGLLPNASSASESQQREWFVSHSVGFVRSVTPPEWRNASLTSWTMTLSRVNITPSVWVDAVTIESEVARMDLEHVEINGSRYYQVDGYRASTPDKRYPEAKIGAFAVCNDSGLEGMTTLFDYDPYYYSEDYCGNTSASSIYVFSSGKYLQAEAVNTQLYDKNGTTVSAYNFRTYYKDLRYVYSTTFSRINWRLQNLSQAYDTACQDADGCMGLDATLVGSNQRLLVAAKALPLDQVLPVILNEYAQSLDLVTVRRPSTVRSNSSRGSGDSGVENDWLGDVLLGHNVANLTDDIYYDGMPRVCRGASSRRVQNYANNHIYMESTLQAAYTAAAFLLFQNAIAHDVLNQSAASNGVVLKLDQNIQEMSVRLSIPRLNAVLTLAGCVVLVVVLILVLVASLFAGSTGHPSVQDPHQIARVMVDDTTFPSLLLKRRVLHKGVEGDADEFVINTLAVGPTERTTEATAV